ncbi:hypothetical protein YASMINEVIRUS_1325 [Yasminevirus sp. GU-2018]|uniref:Leucine-rich repeat protein n=1 Tax=Yasminevirus sp. GU-2018 TaxID=2420051 RepID=A0A5K0UB62_9VIRU|nr:hypothetical protein YASMINEVIRUS_1325 [Yasminevirus sp. GU-2018]
METIYNESRPTDAENSDTGLMTLNSKDSNDSEGSGSSVVATKRTKLMTNCKDLFKWLVEVPSSKTQNIVLISSGSALDSKVSESVLTRTEGSGNTLDNDISIDTSSLERDGECQLICLKGDLLDPRKRISCGINFVVETEKGEKSPSVKFSVDISYNFIRRVSFDSTVSQCVRSLNLRSNNLEDIDLSSLTNLDHLNVSDNVIDYSYSTEGVESSTQDSGSCDGKLDLSRNPCLKTISLLGVGFRNIVIPGSRMLEKAEIVFVGKIPHTVETNMRYLNSIKYLHLENCSVGEIFVDDATAKIETLILKKAKLSKFRLESLLIPSVLTHLDLSDNNIEEIDLSSALSLRHLNINKNKIKQLDLSRNSKLETLHASTCSLLYLKVPTSIKVLDVSFNDLGNIIFQTINQVGSQSSSNASTANLANLTHLNIESNLMTYLNLSACRNLTSLIVKSNKFEFLSDLVLPVDPSKLEMIDVSDNRLRLKQSESTNSLDTVNLEKYESLSRIVMSNSFVDATGSLVVPSVNLKELRVESTPFEEIEFSRRLIGTYFRHADTDLIIKDNTRLKSIDFKTGSSESNFGKNLDPITESTLAINRLELSNNPSLVNFLTRSCLLINPCTLVLSNFEVESFQHNRQKQLNGFNNVCSDTLEVVRAGGVKHTFNITNLTSIDISRNPRLHVRFGTRESHNISQMTGKMDCQKECSSECPQIDFAWLSKVSSITKIKIDDPKGATLLFPGSYSVKNIRFSTIDENLNEDVDGREDSKDVGSDLSVSIVQTSRHNNTNFVLKYSGLPGGDGSTDGSTDGDGNNPLSDKSTDKISLKRMIRRLYLMNKFMYVLLLTVIMTVFGFLFMVLK